MGTFFEFIRNEEARRRDPSLLERITSAGDSIPSLNRLVYEGNSDSGRYRTIVKSDTDLPIGGCYCSIRLRPKFKAGPKCRFGPLHLCCRAKISSKRS
jgi:hypothetical protein